MEREQSRFRGSIEGAPREHGGASREYREYKESTGAQQACKVGCSKRRKVLAP